MHNYDTPTSEYSSEDSIHEMENDFEYENLYESEDESYEHENDSEDELPSQESTFNESTQMELSDELLSVQGEDEMDRYLHRLFGRAVGRKRKSMDRRMTEALVILLKGLSKKLFIHSRHNRRNRHRLNHSISEQQSAFRSEILGQEFEGLSGEDQEFEVRRSFVRLAGNAARRAYRMPNRYSPRLRARRALAFAARRHAPGLFNPAIMNNNYQQPAQEPAPAMMQRLNSLENALGSLTEKINNLQPPANSQPPSGNDAAPPAANAGGADTEYESLYEDYESDHEDYESEEEDYENEDHEGEEYEEEDHEENEYEEEEHESMNDEYEEFEEEDFEDHESEEEDEFEDEDYEAEDNESEEQQPRRRRRHRCKCSSCKGAPTSEFEENEYEENESEDSEYEENESEDNESEEHEFEYENDSEIPDRESTFNETMQMELASELLNVQTEEELDMFLGKLLKKAGKLIKKVAKVALPGPLGKVLKGIAKKVLPIAGGVFGGAMIPGVGNIIGKSVGDAASNLFELEFEGLSQEDQEFEQAKAFVRFAGNAAMRSAMLRRNLPARAKAKYALKHAAKKYAPGLLRKGPQRRNFRNNGNINRRPVRNSAAYLRNQRNQRYRNFRKNNPNRYSQHQRNLWRRHHPGQPFPAQGYMGNNFPQQSYMNNNNPQQPPYPGDYSQQPYPQQPGAFSPQYPEQPQSGGQNAPFDQKLSALENALASLTQKIGSMNSPQGSNGHDLPSGNDDGGNAGQDNEYWN